nr:tetratricopeptide repeat protein [Nocardioides flavescens]
MSPELLERLFVGRDRLLTAVVDRIREASEGTGRNHTLLVGPRGAGKTHLVALAYHRAEALRAAGRSLQLAWLPEDPWSIIGYRHLLAAVASAAGLPSDGDAATLEGVLTQAATNDGPIVVFTENLDWILDSIGNDGQQRLRHLLQDSRALLMIATTTAIDRNLSDQSRPFYGFFTTSRLEPFGVDDAGSMLRAIAAATGQADLERYLGTDEAKARLRAIEHLAGGQPRMWSALASSLSISGLNELVDLLLTRFDDLTPYYQERLARLSPRQRVAVAELAALDRPISVKELAGRLGVDQRSLGKTINELVDRGWAAPVTSPLLEGKVDKRLTFYELAEPLARLAFQIKETRGEPLRVVVDFLKHWFDPDELGLGSAHGSETKYIELAIAAQFEDSVVSVTRSLSRLPKTRAPSVALLDEVDLSLSRLTEGDPSAFLCLPAPVRSAVEALPSTLPVTSIRLIVHQLAATELGRVRHPAMDPWIARAGELATSTGTDLARLQLVRWLARAWRFDEALTGLVDSDGLAAVGTRADVAITAWEAGRFELALELEEWVLEERTMLQGANHPETLTARSNLAATYSSLGRDEEACELKESVVAAMTELLGRGSSDTLAALLNLSTTYLTLGRFEEALATAEEAARGLAEVRGDEHPSTLQSKANLAVVLASRNERAAAIPLLREVSDAQFRVLGPEHPNYLMTRTNLAISLGVTGQHEEALALLSSILETQSQVLGTQHPDSLFTLSSLARAHRAAGADDTSRRLATRAVAGLEVVLGPDHPDTAAVKRLLG